MKIILLLILAAVFAWCSGFRVHGENLAYYLKIDDTNALSEIKLVNGNVMTGVIESETDREISFNTEGVRMTYRKSEIESMKTGLAPDFLAMLRRNYRQNHEKHPLVTHRKEDSLSGKWDEMALEPSRIAEKIKARNPGISTTGRIEQAMAESARARQQIYQKREQLERDLAEEAGKP